jgi:hypothetical protein
MKIAGGFAKRRLLRYFGLATALLLLLIIVCAGALGRYLCLFQAEGNYQGLGTAGYGRSVA